MKLWIRNQNKEALVHINGMIITKAHRIGNGKDELVYMIKETSSDTLLGEYATKERALEVLDEIQNIVIMQQLSEMDSHKFFQSMPKDTKNIKIVLDSMSVYEMPKEWFKWV